ncbi:MAG: DUF4175 family protein, partial [Gemmatimonadales bacterium]
MTAPRTEAAVRTLVRPLRGLTLVARAVVALGVMALLLGALAWLARLGVFAGPYWVLLAWSAALVALIAGLTAWYREQGRLSPAWLARTLEETGQWRRGAVSALLEPAAAGTSASLFAATDASRAREVEGRGTAALAPVSRRFRGRVTRGMLVLAGGLGVFATAGPLNGPASALWHPGRAWEATVAPVTIEASATEIDRGATVELRLKALGRRRATLWLRSPGETWQGRTVELDSAGQAIESIGPLRTDLFARLTSGRRGSDTVMVRVRIPAFLGTVSVTAHYPGYLSLEDEPMPLDGDTLLLPEGTELETSGTATAPLGAGAWVHPGGRFDLETREGAFAGRFTPRVSGEYRLELTVRSGAPLAGDTVRLPVRVIPDSAPQVSIPVPGADTLAPLDLRIPLIIEAQDDHGLTLVELESRRVSRLGLTDDPVTDRIALPGGTPDRVLLPFELDLNRRGLLPGDTLRYFVRARDNAPAGHVGRSREYVIRLPTLAEMRVATREATRDLGSRLDSVASASRQLERQTEDLSLERQRASQDERSRGRQSLSFEAAQRAEAVARSQEQLLQEAEALKQALDRLREAAEAAGLNDPEWQKRLAEIRDQLDRALSPELKDRLAELQKALSELDPERARDALEQLARAQKELRETLERSRELFRRAAVEGDMANLAAESRELAQEQQQWADQTAQADSARASAQEEALAARADSLAADLQQLAPQTEQDGQRQNLEAMADQAAQAAQRMNQAAQSMRNGQRPQARQQGQQAARMLSPMSQQLEQQRGAMQQQWRQEVTAELDRALAETSRLTERQLALAERLRQGDASAGARAEQGALQEGADKLLEQMRQAAGKNALVSPQIGVALTVAQQQMMKARDAISTAAPNTRDAADAAGQAVDALNAAAYQLVRSRGQVGGAGSGSGMQEAMEQMQQLAQQQGGLNAQAGGLLPQAGAQGVQEQLRQLGAQQRRMSDELERLRAKGNMPGAGDLAEEARDLARRLESGRLDRETVQRQERLFRRMLDAGRTLQGQEQDQNKERQSTTARGDSVRLPPALQERLFGRDNLVRMPAWETLQQLSPEERRLVVEYFR